MSVFDSIMRFFNRHWVATNWGPHLGHQDGTSCPHLGHQDGTSCPRHGEHYAARDMGA